MTWLSVLQILLQLTEYVARRADRLDIEKALKSSRASAWPLPVLLAMTCFLAACQSIQTTLTGGTHTAEQADASLSTGVCGALPAVSNSSRDTGEA